MDAGMTSTPSSPPWKRPRSMMEQQRTILASNTRGPPWPNPASLAAGRVFTSEIDLDHGHDEQDRDQSRR
jgi:hypothetical protein